MRKTFESFYPPSIDFFDSLWKDSIVVLDTNVLLDMYRYSERTRNDFLALFEKLSDRLWIPHQVALEFSRNRPDVIAAQVQMYQKAKNLLASLRETTAKEIEKILSFRLHPVLAKEEFQDAFEASISDLEKRIDDYSKQHPDFFDTDPILDSILTRFDGKIGNPYGEARLKEIYSEGKDRYAKNIPPGYEDSRGSNKKEGDAIFGDLIVWNQTIDHVKETKASGVILISNDMKEDWWWFSKGRNLGCRPELRQEMKEKTGAKFHIYTSERFLHFAPNKIQVTINEKSIDEVRNLEKENQNVREKQKGAYFGSLLESILENQKQREATFSNLLSPNVLAAIEENRKRQEDLNKVLASNFGSSSAFARLAEQIRKQQEESSATFASLLSPSWQNLIGKPLGIGGISLPGEVASVPDESISPENNEGNTGLPDVNDPENRQS